GAGLPSTNDLGGRQSAGHDGNASSTGKLYRSFVEAGAHDELRPSLDAALCIVGVQHGSGADHDPVAKACNQARDQLRGIGNGQGHFEDRESSLKQGIDGPIRQFSRGCPHHGYDTQLFDSLRHKELIHRSILAPFPCIADMTSEIVAMVVSPGVDIASAPWATPQASAN